MTSHDAGSIAVAKAPLRWELTDSEREAAEGLERDWTARAMVKTLARGPRLVPHALRLSLRAAMHGVWNDVELGVLMDSERVRQALPGTVRGAAWCPEDSFLDVLMPRLYPGASALEIGCGVGRISRQVAPKIRELTCSDISQVMIREARTNLAEFANVRCIRTTGYWLEGLPDASFDVVFAHAVFVFFDLYPAIAMLDATRRVLRPGGSSVIGFLTMDRPEWSNETVALARSYAGRGTFGARCVRPYTEGQLRAMHEAVGLDVVDCRYGSTGDSGRRTPLIVTATATRPRPAHHPIA